MNALFTGMVASAYVGAVVGVHRWNVWRLRSAAGGFRPLHRLDWDALLEGLLPAAAGARAEPARLPNGAPTPHALLAVVGDDARARQELLAALVHGAPPSDLMPRAEVAGFSGGQAHWLELLALIRADPEEAFRRLDQGDLTTAAELYLREHLRLTRRTHPLNLEISVFAAKRELSAGLIRFGESPALYFARALASSLVGFNRAAIDDLARAVYYSRQAPFYVRAVLDSPYVEEARPALVYQCRQAEAAREAPAS
ncbi:MAG TPA: hypothetical protein VH208_08760 [Myxococcaceae bacterium]|nr:hypothetical protein [Myxococcaceae bacterium]